MRKTWVYLVLFLFCLNCVLAGSTYKLDLEKENSFLFGFLEGDRVEFELKGGTHTIIIDKVEGDSVDLDTFLFINKQEQQVPFFTTIGPKKTLRLDVDKDGNADLFVGVYKTIGNKVELIFKNGVDADLTTGKAVQDVSKPKSYTGFISVLIGLVIILVIFLIVWNRR